MGLLEGLKSVLGLKAEADATREADPDDLFGMSTASVTMEAELGYVPVEQAALCFGDVDSTAFGDAVAEVRAILEAGEDETGTVAEFRTDDFGYRWIVLEDAAGSTGPSVADAPEGPVDFEDLVTSVYFAADTLMEHGFGSRLLAAVFGFEATTSAADPDHPDRVYWLYSFRRGAYYPFAPTAADERDSTIEFRLQSVLDGELDVEDDEAYWYPLWPDDPGAHPWE